ncbi:MAG TPA: hypothetical protein VHZ73_09395 [Vicinamibacterales bacterium]|jgi:hypothetical protein|nr:hypothetical protein [Vicinamibacterales bacterium]
MSKIEVDVAAKADVAKVWIDGTRVTLTNGIGRARVEPGPHHALSWAVRGAPGTSYSLKITAPAEAKLSHTDTFDHDEFDAGLAWFKVLAALCLTLFAGRAIAQSDGRVARMAAAAALTKQAAVATASPIDVAPAFALDGSTSSDTASGQIGFLLGDFALTVGASAPFGGTGAATLADFDGLRAKANASAASAWQHWSVRDGAPQLDAACAAAGLPKGCSILELKRDDSAEGRAALKRALAAIDPGTLWFVGAAGKVAPEGFNYLSRTDLSARRDRRTSWSASAAAGVLARNGVSMTATYTRQRTYEAQSAVQLCRPGPSPASLVCDDEVIGGPGAPARTNQVSVEVRKVFRAFGVSPKVTYNSLRNATGIQLPLYFLQDPSGGLRGGIILGWRSDTRAFTARAVVGQVLGMLTK